MFFERCCPICRRSAAAVCDRCWDQLEPAEVRWLASPRPGTAHDLEVRPLFNYSADTASMLLAAKNGGRREVLRQLGKAIAASLTDVGPLDAVTWVPASTANRRTRGFDQGRLLARTIAAGLELPARSFLTRPAAVSSTSQKGKGRTHRLQGAALVASRPVSARRLLLVDDVVTTGASLRHGADALFAAGASLVVAATAASVDHGRQRGPEVTFGLQPGVGQPA